VPASRFAPLLFSVFLLPLHAQDDGRDVPDGPIKMVPEFALAFPLEQQGRNVTVKFPVLVNRDTIIKPGMILRNAYVPPLDTDSVNLNAAHLGNMAQAFSRQTSQSPDAAAISSNAAHEIERQRRVVWSVPVNFQLAMAQLPTDSLHLIYCPTPNDNRNLDDERFDFYEGLLLGSPTGKVTVLGVEVGSKADEAGFKAGDDVVSVGGIPMPDNLEAFPQIYVRARQTAKDNNADSMVFVVRAQGASTTRTLNLAMPPQIKSLLMQGL
jgi:hypothetical protein